MEGRSIIPILVAGKGEKMKIESIFVIVVTICAIGCFLAGGCLVGRAIAFDPALEKIRLILKPLYTPLIIIMIGFYLRHASLSLTSHKG